MTNNFDDLSNSSQLLLSIVRRGMGNQVVDVTRSAGSSGGTILHGRGTGSSTVMEYIGLGDQARDIIVTVASEVRMHGIIAAIEQYAVRLKRRVGVSMLINVSQVLTYAMKGELSPRLDQRSDSMNHAKYTLIVFIVNDGYADDAMAAARKAGASGGTILHARGTGKKEDVKFFGIDLIPEKEMLLILEEREKAYQILESIQQLKYFKEPGSGIAFCIDTEKFISLGVR